MSVKCKSVFKRAFCVLLCLALAVGGIAALTGITQRKDSVGKYSTFWTDCNDLDILYLGTSHILNAAFPMELWSEYGYTSYNLGGNSNTMVISYWTLMNALDYTTPKLVVLDCFETSYDDKCRSTFFAHHSLDAFPLSSTKVAAIYDIFSAPEDRQLRSDFLFKFSLYHTRWKELTASDFIHESKADKGAEPKIGISAPAESSPTDEILSPSLDNTGFLYLDKIIDECEKRGIDILLTYLPFPAPEKSWMEANYVQTLAQERGLDYINFLKLDIVDFTTDCLDSTSHLNPSGAKKVTHYLGEYIREHYDIADHRGDKAYAHWDDDLIKYLDTKAGQMFESDDLSVWLMLLSDSYFDCCIYIKPQSPLLADKTVQSLILNLGEIQGNISSSVFESGSGCLIVKEDGALRICTAAEDEPLTAVTARGTFSIERRGDETELCLDGEDIYDAANSIEAIVSYSAGSTARTVGFAAAESRYLISE